MTTNEEKKLPATVPGTGVTSPIDYGEDFGIGFGEVDASDQLLPIIQLVQANAKCCIQGTPQYVAGAQGGMFLDTIARTVIPGDPGIIFVPAYVTHAWVEWIPHDAGGGYRGRQPFCPPEQLKGCRPDPEGRIGKFLNDERGTELIDTRYLWGLVLETVDADHPSMVAVFPLTSSKVQPFRHWLNIAGKVTDGMGKAAPPFGHRVRISSKLEPNPKKGNPYFYTRMLPITQTTGEKSSLDEARKSMLPRHVEVSGQKVDNPVYMAARQLHQDVHNGLMSSSLDASLGKSGAEDDPEVPAGKATGPTKAPF